MRTILRKRIVAAFAGIAPALAPAGAVAAVAWVAGLLPVAVWPNVYRGSASAMAGGSIEPSPTSTTSLVIAVVAGFATVAFAVALGLILDRRGRRQLRVVEGRVPVRQAGQDEEKKRRRAA